jgi:hypothetical protein
MGAVKQAQSLGYETPDTIYESKFLGRELKNVA